MLFLNALSICIIIGLTSIITYLVAVKIQINEATRYNTIMVTQISMSIDNMVESFNRVMDGVAFDEEIQRLLQKEYINNTEKYQLNKQLSSLVVDGTMMSDEVDLIYLYDRKNARVKLRRSVNDKSYQYFDELHLNNYDESGKVTWNIQQSAITANRMIYNLDSYYMNVIGYLTMSMNKSYLQNRIKKFDPTEERYIFILDDQDNLVLSNSGYKKIDSWLTDQKYDSVDSDSFIEVPGYGRMLVSVDKSDLTGWKIISLISLNEITEGPTLIQRTIFIIGFVAILVGIIMIWISTNHIVRPLNKLSLVMDEVEKDNFNVQVQLNRIDELGRVGDSFNRMMNKINTLISDIYKKDINEKDAQLRALRAQINPHFLYNTLDAINWMAQFGKTEDVSKMTISLSRLLKSSIQNKKEFINLKDEIKYIEDYMAIQKIRFQGKIQYSIQLDPDTENCLVPKLILQPLVENAMVHGLEKKVEKGYLFINASVVNNQLHIQVLDNGAGMDKDVLNSLLTGEYVPTKDNGGTGNGIANVRNRIKLLYGKDYGLKIESNVNVGTFVELILPTNREGYNV